MGVRDARGLRAAIWPPAGGNSKQAGPPRGRRRIPGWSGSDAQRLDRTGAAARRLRGGGAAPYYVPPTYGTPAYTPTPSAALPPGGGPVPLTPPAPLVSPPAASPPPDLGLGALPDAAGVVPPPAPSVETAPLAGPPAAANPPPPAQATAAPPPADTDPTTAIPDSGAALNQRLDAIRAQLAQDKAAPSAAAPPSRPNHYGGLSSQGDVVPGATTP